MPDKADKHIRVTDETWKELNSRKEPGDSFDDVLSRLLEEDRENGQGNSNPTAMAD